MNKNFETIKPHLKRQAIKFTLAMFVLILLKIFAGVSITDSFRDALFK